MSLTSWSVFRVGLFSNWRPSVISLISIGLLRFIIWSACFWQGPSWEVLFGRRISTSFWHISSRTDCIGCSSLVFECSCASSSKAKSVGWFFDDFWSLFRIILWAWCLLKTVYLHSWLSSYFRCWCSRLSAKIGLNWIIKESSIFIKIIFWFISSLTFSSSKWPTGWFPKLDFILVTIHGSWWHLSCIVKFC